MPNFVSPGAMAGNAIVELLIQREQQQRQRMLDELMQQEMSDRRNKTGLDQMQQDFQNQRTVTADRRVEEDRARAEDTRQAQARQQQNQIGVRGMMADAMTQGPLTPDSAKTIGIMAFREGMQAPPEVEQMLEPPAEPSQFTLNEGDTRYDTTGKVIARGAPKREPQGSAPAGEWVKDASGKIIKRVPQPGDTPYDAVAARSAQPQNTESADTAREVSRIASELSGHPGFSGTFGKFSAAVPDVVASQDTVNARILLKSLKGLLTIENMGKMKGVLSDSDMRILQQASTTLDAPMSEPAAKAELDRLVEVMSRGTGGGTPQPGPTGTGGGFRVIGVR